VPVSTKHGHIGLELQVQREILLLEERFDDGAGLAQEGIDVDVLVTPLDASGFHFGEV
jgi:hypothetical protein